MKETYLFPWPNKLKTFSILYFSLFGTDGKKKKKIFFRLAIVLSFSLFELILLFLFPFFFCNYQNDLNVRFKISLFCFFPSVFLAIKLRQLFSLGFINLVLIICSLFFFGG